MDLAALLLRVRSLEALSEMLAALGHVSMHEAAPGLAGRRAEREGAALVVGRAGEFPWFAVEGSEPERLARRVARRLTVRGRVGGVLALDGAGRRLGLAVAFAGVPSLEIDLVRPAGAALACLGRLAAPTTGGVLAYAAQAADALSGEAVGRRFFGAFKATLDRMAQGLPTRLRGEDRRSLALLQLTRVLFLYFIQAKGWLAGRERFLAEAVDQCLFRKRRIHRDLLRPLFFGTLNRPAAGRSRTARAFGSIPFLNGGLFEPHPLERSLRGDIPNAIWRDAFDGLFERFHFVVSEGGAAGIAPDMLGRVFEGVMAPSARRASGSYYTPAALVRSVLDAALGAHLAARLGCTDAEAERRLSDGDATAAGLLDGVTLLDPAAGSGAFLLGALERLSALPVANGAAPAAARRRILQRSLFGVDRSAAAVRLTELRLWLAVIAEDREERPARVEALPNLDCLIRQGDSLFEPLGGQVRLGAPDARLAQEVAALRRRLVTASGLEKRELARGLRAAECRAAGASLLAAESEARARIAECLAAGRSLDLFGQRRGADGSIRRCLADNRADLRALRSARRTLLREREVPWFQYQSHFADVFAGGGGFDIVAGNPPWLRAEEIPAETRRRLEGRYRWWRGGGRGFSHRPDLAVAFLERGVELAAPGGIVALLVPAKVATAGYATAARHALATSTTLLRVADLTGNRDAAFDATVYPLALIARKAPPQADHRVRTWLGATTESTEPPDPVPQAALVGGGPWILSSDRAGRLASQLRGAHPAVGDRFTCRLGLKTGANRLFLDPPAGLPPSLLRWAVRGRDLRPFRPHCRVRLLWTHGPDGAPLPRLPPDVAALLAPHESLLRARADFGGGPPWTLFRTRGATATHRVVWSDLARQLTACALTDPRDRARIPLNTCYVAAAASAEEAERLAAWLNASWVRALARIGAMPAAGGFRRYSAALVGGLPLPVGVLTDPSFSAMAIAGRRGEPVQEALDELAAAYLELSARNRQTLSGLLGRGAADRR